jgi:hypothetical protein
VAPDLRDRDFVTQRYEHGKQHEYMKCEIVMCLRIKPTVTARGHMEGGVKRNKISHSISGKLKSVREMIVAVHFKEKIDCRSQRSFHDFGHRDVEDKLK